ncbi:MAG TPA: molybdopterin-dependent oxidoreductase [Thermoanaerobaculia bacterium]|nr:molybdopterin-dependent oxidoreductase [Thermoanaerobaculia bacterium]
MAETNGTTHRTYCPLDCPDCCSLEVKVEGGKVVKLDGDQRNPVTQGFICTKVRHFPQRLYGPKRLLRPGVRDGAKGEGKFRPVSWGEALDLVAGKLRETVDRHGGEAILPYSYGGGNGVLSQDAYDARLFRRLGALNLAPTVCAAATSRAAEAMYGQFPGVAYQDVAEARLVVVWGANPSVSSIHLVPYVLEAKRRGARLVVIDPRRIALAKQADLHLAVNPGTDLAVALSLVRWLFASGRADRRFLTEHADGAEELERRAEPWTFEAAASVAGVPASDLETFARWYAESSPALIRCGWGPERNRNGGSAVAAILTLPAVAGKFGVRGGGYMLSNASAWNLSTEGAVAAPPTDTPTLNMNRLGRALLGETKLEIRLLFVFNSNPLATLPEQEKVRAGLRREDLFTVVFDPVLTDTARYADVVLPATTFLEQAELSRGYGAYVAQRSRPVIAPVGESRSNFEVFRDLVRQLGLGRPGDPEDPEEWVAAALGADGRAEELAPLLAEQGIGPARFPRPVQMVDVLPATANGRIQLCSEDLDQETGGWLYHFRPNPEERAGSLTLISPATSKAVCSTLGELDGKVASLELHPDDAAARGLEPGDIVRVWNYLGEVRCPLALSRDLRPGVAFLPKALWSHHTLNGVTANALAANHPTDFAEGATFNDARVEVELVERPTRPVAGESQEPAFELLAGGG